MSTNITSLTTYDNLTIEEVVSRGNMFTLLKARTETKYVILKVATNRDGMSESLLRREYELMASLAHQSIVSVIGLCDAEEYGLAIIMEYIAGETLDIALRSSHSNGWCDKIIDDILAATKYLHRRGITHNDLKPQNIIVNSNGHARIVDFGLSSTDDSIYSGVIGGSNGFTAPEVLEHGKPAGPRSDIYSIGQLIGVISSRYSKIVKRCTAREPMARYGNIAELEHALQLKRRTPLYIILTSIVLIIIALSITPLIEQSVATNKLETEQATAHNSLDSLYRATIVDIERQPYKEFAGIVRNNYLQHAYQYLMSLDENNRLGAEMVLSEHIHTLDSIMLTRPTILSVDPSLQSDLINRFNSNEIF